MAKSKKLIIKGRIPSKKNETKKGKYGNFYNAKQTEIDDVTIQLKSQRKGFFTDKPIRVSYLINTHSRKQDRSNIIATIDDCLEKSGIIKNDRQIERTYSSIYFMKNIVEYVQVEINTLDEN